MHAEPQKEHQWLQKLVGEWTFEHEMVIEPGQPAVKFGGKEKARSLGGLWVICEGQGAMPGGGTSFNMFTFGYDPDKKRFVGTFIASVMAQLWIYEGELDAAGKTLTLHTQGPSFTDPSKQAPYKDVIEFVNDDHRMLSSHFQNDDGTWRSFMTAHYHRVK